MQRINLQSSQKLTWIQPKAFTRYWELQQDGQVVGTMSWRGVFSQKSTVEFADGQWHFDQPRLFKSDIHVSKEGQPGEVAVGRLNWRGHGKIEFADGRTYSWKRSGVFRVRWQLVNDMNQDVLEMARKGKFFRMEADIRMSPFVSNDPHLSPVIGFLWYLVQVERRRAAVTASV